MDLFDVVGPVMVGPSSSHTAGAVKMGYVAGVLMGEPLQSASILLYGSFLATGDGHGTKKAIVAGLLGMLPDDYRIGDSVALATQQGIAVSFGEARLDNAHPNTAVMQLVGVSGRRLEVVGESLGGGRINIARLDGVMTNFAGDCPTLIVYNEDRPGHVAEVTSMLSKEGVNIATMRLFRTNKGGNAVMVLECDQEVPESGIGWLRQLQGVIRVTYLPGK